MSEKEPLIPSEDLSSEEMAACPSIFDKPDHSSDRQAKQRRLSRAGRNTLIALVLCLALAGSAFAVIRLLPESEGEDGTSSYSDTQTLFDYSNYLTYDSNLTEKEGVEKVLVSNQQGQFEIGCAVVEKTEQNATTGEDEKVTALEWNVVGQDGVSFDSATLQSLVGQVLKVTYTTEYAQDADAQNGAGETYRKECGLDQPTATVTAQFRGGRTVTVKVGSQVPIGGSYYLMAEGDSKIYISKEMSVNYLLDGMVDFVTKKVVSPIKAADLKNPSKYFSEDGSLTKFDKITLSGSRFPEPIVFQTSDTADVAVSTNYRMTAPAAYQADDDKVKTLLAPLANGLDATQCLVMKASAADRAEYGLDAPLCKVQYVLEGKELVLTVGKLVESGYYAVSYTGNPGIYQVAESAVSFLAQSAKDFRSILLYVTNITDVSSVRVDAVDEDGKLVSETFTLHHESKTTESGTTNSLSVTDSKGNFVNEGDFKNFYTTLISMTAADWVEDSKQAATPKATVTLKYLNGKGSDVIRLSEYSSRRYFYTINGKGSATVLGTTVDTLLSQFSELL